MDQRPLVKDALRMISTSKPRNYGEGVYFSKKAVTYEVPYANPMELVFMYWMDQNPEITHFNYENLAIPYKFENKTRMYHPDYEVFFRNKLKSIWELKQRRTTGGNKTIAKARAATTYAAEHGYDEYKIFTLPEVTDLISI